jgi:hypothetical protein
VSGLEQLRENLREAARRQVESDRARARRVRRRASGLVALLLLGGAAAAGATNLIAVGVPARDARAGDVPSQIRPASPSRLQIVVRAPGRNGAPGFGVGIYTARNGARCALVGHVRGIALGVVEGDVFRPYAADRAGSCRDRGRPFLDLAHFRGVTALFGRAAAGTRSVHATIHGKVHTAPIGPGGAFLLVFDGDVQPSDLVDFGFR